MAVHPLADRPDDPPDSVLLDGIRGSDTSALDAAMRRHWTPLMRYARGLSPDNDTAEDATQEAFIRLWRNRRKWRSSEALRALLFRMVRNRLLNGHRSDRTRAKLLRRLARRPQRQPPTPAQLAEQADLAKAAETAVARLPQRRREAFVLVRHAGMSYREAAEVMGVSPQTVANQVSAALSSLRDMLADHLPASEPRALPFRSERRTG